MLHYIFYKQIINLGIIASFFLGIIRVSSHPLEFNSIIKYSKEPPPKNNISIANWKGARFDAENIGGSGENINGSPNNGTSNDQYTYVSHDRSPQGQTFTTGNNPDGYDLISITIQMVGYTINKVTEDNLTFWNMKASNGPILLTIGEINETTLKITSIQCFTAGGEGNPGSGSNANGPGTYITFLLPFQVHLKPNTIYCFDLAIGNGANNYFEWLGTNTNSYPEGTAYTRSGNRIKTLSGDRVFMLNMKPSVTSQPSFVHPGTLHTESDFERMRTKIANGEEPWKTSYNILISSPYAQTNWRPAPVTTIIRTGAHPWLNNYTRTQMDAQAIYQLSLRWKITGDTNYADHAVMIANEWAKTLKGINGDSNAALGCSIPGYLFAVGGEILSTYQNWTIDDRKAYMDMMMQIFYPANMNFLWWHYDTYWRTGGNTHYRSNWDTAAIAALAAIGILCDNKAVYLQALDFFKYGPGNGRIERAAWYIHPNGLAQGEEAGRDQAHNLGAWHAIALLCQMAWNQGDDLFSYDNYRVLRAFEYNAKYNLGYEVPYARHRNCDLKYTEGTISVAQRGLGGYYQWELVYNHYTNIKGISAPWSEKAAIATRPEPRPNPRFHPSQLDWFGLGSLTYSRDPIPKGVRPNNLAYQWSKGQITLNWIGTAYATGYNIKRATTHGGPYSIIEKTEKENTFYTDTNVVNGTTYYYVISANTPSGETENSPELKVKQELKHHFPFEENLSDIINGQNGRAHGGNTGLPSYAIGFPEGKSIYLDGIDDYIQLPSGIANYQDITIATWVNWSGGNAWQRIFDFGSEIEKTLFLTPANREGKIQLGFTTTRGGNVVGDASYYLIGPEMPINKWTHLAFTINGDIMTLYVNGIPVDYKTNDLIDPLFSQIFCYLGRSMYNNDPYFHGYIDDFRIYNYPLSPKEISDLVVQGYKTNAGENK